MLLLNYILLITAFLLMIPVAIFVLQVFFATFRKNKTIHFPNGNSPRPSIAVLMPAHNESLVITRSIEAIKQQLLPGDAFLVIADNCTDDTASIAGALGATVVKRDSQDQRGKGYALDCGLQYIKQNSPKEIILIIDADCIVSENSIAQLSAACWLKQRPIQALYLMETQENPSLKTRIAAFAWIVKNKVRPLGSVALGFPCQLMGTGMAFLWSDITSVSLASGHIVEDMKLGVDLARINKPPLFLPSAKVTSVFPTSDFAVGTQRTRWEHGHLSVILSEAPKLFYEAVKSNSYAMFGLACDLLVPPLALLIMLCFILFILSLLVANLTLIAITTASLLGLIMSVLLSWLKFGRGCISFKQLCYAPIYALFKIPLYIKFFLNRQVEWVRSKRD